ncbi:MAG: (Fe-S)-binding protein [Deltaproteobacteria bacterium]|nr:(Fe-S)-binding protein [Deltaproteobacteria bacterium]
MGFKKWFPEAFEEFRCVSVFELLKEYIEEGRIKLDKSKYEGKKITLHHPCNYFRKSQMMFGQHYLEEYHFIIESLFDKKDIVQLDPDALNDICCGAGGGAWAMPYDKERLDYGKWKAEQIKATGADIVCAPCHNCRDQIMKGIPKEWGEELGLTYRTYYIWELVAEAIVHEPWSEEEVKKSHEERDKQYKRDDIDLDEEEEY